MTETGIRIVAEPVAAAEPVLEAIKKELRAFNRQANPAFYGKVGYALVGKVEDRDGHGHAKHYFTRTIA